MPRILILSGLQYNFRWLDRAVDHPYLRDQMRGFDSVVVYLLSIVTPIVWRGFVLGPGFGCADS